MFSSRATCRPRARARSSASALSLPPDHMSAYRSADTELRRDDAIADLPHAQAGDAAARRAVARAEVRARAVEAEDEAAADLVRRVVGRIDRVPAVSHGRPPPPRARARTRS